MVEQQITIINKLGLHARAAAKLAKTCGRFGSKITIGSQQTRVDGKSVMSLMLLAASKGTELVITSEGKDEQQAMEAIVALINNRFDEEE
ncbi:HPr family phosphocarrier protein [Aurantivibrio plasticivorans]